MKESEIIVFVKKQKEVDRGVIKRCLFGTNRTLGLVNDEYIFAVDKEKRRWGKRKDYHLTTKGLLAVLSTSEDIFRIKLFQKIIRMLENEIKNENLSDIIINYVIIQIRFFLSWHAKNGIHLTRQKNSVFYCNNFIQTHRGFEFDFRKFPKIQYGKKYLDSLVEIKTNYLAYQNIIHALHELNILEKPNLIPNTTKPNNETIVNLKNPWIIKGKISYFFIEWPFFFEESQKYENDFDKIPFTKLLKHSKNSRDNTEDVKLKRIISKNMKSLGIKESQYHHLFYKMNLAIKRNEMEQENDKLHRKYKSQ